MTEAATSTPQVSSTPRLGMRQALSQHWPKYLMEAASSVTELPQHEVGFRKGFRVRDPDGHVLRVIEP